MAEISLRRKKIPHIPDNSSNIVVLFEDIANPLTDENGNIKLTSELGDDGNPLPEYPEIPVSIQIPENTSIDISDTVALKSLIESLMSEAVTRGSQQAQERANKLELRSVLKPLIAEYVEKSPEDVFAGQVEGVTEYLKKIVME